MRSMLSRRRFLSTSSVFGGALYTLSTRNRLLATSAPLIPQDTEGPEIPVSVYKRRVAAVQSELAKRDLGALVVFSLQAYDTRYLTGHAPGLLLVPAVGDPTLFTSGQPHLWLADVRAAASPDARIDQCAARLKELGLEKSRIALGGEFDWAVKPRLANSLPTARVEPGDEVQDRLRLVKDEYEVALLRRTQTISDAQLLAGQQAIAPGRRDWDVLAELVKAGVTSGAEIDQCTHYIGYGPGTDDLWAPPTGRRIQAGEVVNFEGIVYHRHYVIETPVTFAVGRVSAKQNALANVNFEAFQAGVAEIKPGKPLAAVVDASNAVLKKNGFEKMIRRHGHFSGLANSDRPSFDDAIKAGLLLAPGMIMSYHTTITDPNKEAIVIVGREVLVTKDGYEFLSKIKPTPMIATGS